MFVRGSVARHSALASPWAASCRILKRRGVVVAATSTNPGVGHKKLVFLGTPEVAADVLKRLLQVSRAENAGFEVAAVVTQPGKPKGRGNRAVAVPSPVEQAARDLGFDNHRILCPASAKEEGFLRTLAELQPDLCVTAAYGNMLPTRFLDIPSLGTLNIHPSLLPKYRGAAPVPRAIQAGELESGVSVAYTVLRCDAGPVLAQQRVAVGPDEQAPELLQRLFRLGTQLLVDNLDTVWAGRGKAVAQPQDEAQVSHASKMTKEEGHLDVTHTAQVLHNKVRAFAGWPGTVVQLNMSDTSAAKSADGNTLELKILRTRLAAPDGGSSRGTSNNTSSHHVASASNRIVVEGGRMFLPCGSGSWLEVLELQPPSKKAMPATAFVNGLVGKVLSTTTACSP